MPQPRGIVDKVRSAREKVHRADAVELKGVSHKYKKQIEEARSKKGLARLTAYLKALYQRVKGSAKVTGKYKKRMQTAFRRTIATEATASIRDRQLRRDVINFLVAKVGIIEKKVNEYYIRSRVRSTLSPFLMADIERLRSSLAAELMRKFKDRIDERQAEAVAQAFGDILVEYYGLNK